MKNKRMKIQRPFRFFILASLVLSGLLASPVYSVTVYDARSGKAQVTRTRAPSQTLIYQDNFEDGDFSHAGGADGLT